ncbi:MAG: helix-turn-helix domain-containing protein [Calditrichaeota bacterium]|nr:helix-turn-helix domain-containing protein [Calditrichota bacterium]
MFGERLKRLRREKGLRQEELASRTGINRSYLSILENDRSSPTMEVVERLAQGLGVSIWTLISTVDEKHYAYDADEDIEMYEGLRDFLEDTDEMLLADPTPAEIDELRGIRFRGNMRPDKRFFRDALLALRRREKGKK